MNYWLMKNEPEVFGIEDLRRRKRARWDGIRNYQVRNMLRDKFAVGDKAIFYHSSAGKETGAAGVMEIVRTAYPDPLQFDVKSKYFDVKSQKINPRWLAVDVAFVCKFTALVTLPTMRVNKALHTMKILTPGNRLSVTRLSKNEFDTLSKLGGR